MDNAGVRDGVESHDHIGVVAPVYRSLDPGPSSRHARRLSEPFIGIVERVSGDTVCLDLNLSQHALEILPT